ncbi:MAG: hypothetical protein IJ817_00040, partial [Clostridia bacterium]|nr:hypothetical protein [Clostridia bacterium]
MKKKLFVLMLTIFMSVAAICGCVSNSQKTDLNSESSLTEVDQNQTAKTKTSGTWYDYQNGIEKNNNVIHIKTGAELSWWARRIDAVGDENDCYRTVTAYLDNDIDMSAHYWDTTIGTSDGWGDNWIWGWSHNFFGTFYGNGHTIYGLTFNSSSHAYGGLFGTLSGATVQDLNVVIAGEIDPTVFGGIASRIYNGSRVINCTVSGSIKATDTYDEFGGIVGYATGDSKIYSCTNYATFNITNAQNGRTGGIVGKIEDKAKVYGCSNLGDFGSIGLKSGTNDATGGIVGYVGEWDCVVEDCVNYAVIKYNAGSNTTQNTGGIVGMMYNNSTINRCINYGNIYGGTNSKCVGGIIGLLGGTYWSWFADHDCVDNAVANCLNYAETVNGNEAWGPIVGQVRGDTVRGCYMLTSGFAYSVVFSLDHGNPYDTESKICWNSTTSYRTSDFFSSHSYDFTGTLNGHNVYSWSSVGGQYPVSDIGYRWKILYESGSGYGFSRTNFYMYWDYNNAVYDFLSCRYTSGDQETLKNIYNQQSPILLDACNTFTVSLKYYRSNASSTLYDSDSNIATVTSSDGVTKSQSNRALTVTYLQAAPYKSAGDQTGGAIKNLFRVTKNSTNKSYITLDASKCSMTNTYGTSTDYFSQNGSYSEPASHTGRTDISCDFGGRGGVLKAFSKYYTATSSDVNNTITIVFKVKSKDISIKAYYGSSAMTSGATIKIKGTKDGDKTFTTSGSETVGSVAFYYKDGFSYEVTPRIGYVLESVDDSAGNKLTNGATEWFKYNISEVKFKFRLKTYNIVVYDYDSFSPPSLNDYNYNPITWLVGYTSYLESAKVFENISGWKIGKSVNATLRGSFSEIGHKYKMQAFSFTPIGNASSRYSLASNSVDMDSSTSAIDEYGYVTVAKNKAKSLSFNLKDIFASNYSSLSSYTESDTIYLYVSRPTIKYNFDMQMGKSFYNADLPTSGEAIKNDDNVYQPKDANVDVRTVAGAEIVVNGNNTFGQEPYDDKTNVYNPKKKYEVQCDLDSSIKFTFNALSGYELKRVFLINKSAMKYNELPKEYLTKNNSKSYETEISLVIQYYVDNASSYKDSENLFKDVFKLNVEFDRLSYNFEYSVTSDGNVISEDYST